jgi:hypothetical protein
LGNFPNYFYHENLFIHFPKPENQFQIDFSFSFFFLRSTGHLAHSASPNPMATDLNGPLGLFPLLLPHTVNAVKSACHHAALGRRPPHEPW